MTTGFAYITDRVPAPPISYSPNARPSCHNLVLSPTGHTYHCGRRTGHTGRCASYSLDRVIATWETNR